MPSHRRRWSAASRLPWPPPIGRAGFLPPHRRQLAIAFADWLYLYRYTLPLMPSHRRRVAPVERSEPFASIIFGRQ